MFDEPTINDFVARIEFHIQRSLSSAAQTVKSIEHKANAKGQYRSGNTVTQIFRDVLAEFESCINGALEELRHSIKASKLNAREMRDIFGEHLGVYRDQMKNITKHDKLRSFSSGPGFERFIDEQLEKFDDTLDFKLRQFDVGFSHRKDAHVTNMVIVHGDGNSVIAGNGNVAQQGTHDSQISVQAEDISQKLTLIEKELANVKLSNAELAEMRGWLNTIKAQLSRPTPSVSIIAEAAHSLKRVIENAAGNLLAHPLGQATMALAAMFGLS